MGEGGERDCVFLCIFLCVDSIFLSVRACVSSVCGPVCIFAFVYV